MQSFMENLVKCWKPISVKHKSDDITLRFFFSKLMYIDTMVYFLIIVVFDFEDFLNNSKISLIRKK